MTNNPTPTLNPEEAPPMTDTPLLRYLTISELIYINGRLLENAKLMTGKQKVRDIDLLDAAVQRPAASAFGQDAYPTLREKVAALLHSVARNHPFTDGNKRTATVAAVMMFEVNGWRVAWDRQEALDAILHVAENRWDIDRLAAWFPLVPGEATPEADAEKDIVTIDRIMLEQKWLLDELKER
ncbi:MAG: type II toxin-antitoxin system death-on-curing family toxin [bacterium]|nr:type II toxin-antitoxin system death-on-curing family toxin [bacterium]